MPSVTPTAVTLADLADAAHAVNLLGGTVDSPRTNPNSPIVVPVTDDNGAFWVQDIYLGEWKRDGMKRGGDTGNVILPV